MTDRVELKGCYNPECGSDDVAHGMCGSVYCGQCGVYGPDHDPTGEKWNALPRRGEAVGDIDEASFMLREVPAFMRSMMHDDSVAAEVAISWVEISGRGGAPEAYAKEACRFARAALAAIRAEIGEVE